MKTCTILFAVWTNCIVNFAAKNVLKVSHINSMLIFEGFAFI